MSGGEHVLKQFKYGKYDFAFDRMVDGVTVGAFTGGMKLRFLTVAVNATEKGELRLMADSKDIALVVLADTPYYESLENAMKIRKYIKQRNVAQLPKTVQDIIRDQQELAYLLSPLYSRLCLLSKIIFESTVTIKITNIAPRFSS